ncbi:acyltransferase family protein [uncultured Roseobacter sp.]|uniref:acyltransferase family protein n=1 Tax=uncultured Roseobacter sp. TaxID=114847 RepID=UPI0026155C49|nr:acyltransferase family protein [uncultured Roseobacter sp.]
MQYRREIDGLRAVAVLPVILHHAGLKVFSGGYVGVDVFFVISGFLITSILISDLEQGKFSIARFYERRARRILPALFVVMFACIPFAYMWMFPAQLKDFSQSIVATVFFGSNILFWREAGYFAPAAELKPLLHTWSLAVEEQYYLLFPLFLFGFWRFGRRSVFGAIIVIAAFSLILAEWGWRNAPSANYYLAPTRAWELLSGSMCAFLTVGKSLKPSNVLSIFGLALILFAVFSYDANTPFPSIYALTPVTGTSLIIIFAAKETWVARILSLRAFVGIGLISYSAYLWHQPLFAFARIYSITEPSFVLMTMLAFASLLLAWATWSWVEQPFRKGANSILTTQASVFTLGALIGSLIVALGLVGHIQDGFKGRLNQKTLAALQAPNGDTSGCHNGLEASEIAQGKICKIGFYEHAPSVAIVGDSHASRLTDALSYEFQKLEISAVTYNGSWCAPLINFATDAPGKNGCLDEINAAFSQILSSPNITTVILHAQWANYTLGMRWPETTPVEYIFNEDGNLNFSFLERSNNTKFFKMALNYTVQQLLAQNKKIILVLPVPEHKHDVVNTVAKSHQIGRNPNIFSLSEADYKIRTLNVKQVLLRVAEQTEILTVDPFEIMCANGYCPIANDGGLPLYEDGNHLNYIGSLPIAKEIAKSINF